MVARYTPDECSGIDETVRCVVKFGGFRALYRGLLPTLIAMFPYVGVEFMVYETLKRRWELWVGGTVGVGALAVQTGHPLSKRSVPGYTAARRIVRIPNEGARSPPPARAPVPILWTCPRQVETRHTPRPCRRQSRVSQHCKVRADM